MQEIRTILAYIEGMTAEIPGTKGLSPKQWGLIKVKLEQIGMLLDQAPIVVPAAVAPAAPPAPVGPKVWTERDWVINFRATAKSLGMEDGDLDDSEVRGHFSTPTTDPVEAATNWVEYMNRG